MQPRQKDIKNLLSQFQQYAERIYTATEPTLDETDVEKQARIKRLLNNPKAFQEYYLPFLKETPEYLLNPIKLVLQKKDYFGWWQMFRGARKSTWLNQILPMMLLAKGEIGFMLLIGPNETFSMRLLGSLQTQLENNQRFIQDFGQQKHLGSWAEGEFTTKSGVSFVGLGMGQPVRGLNIQMKRPDYIVCSDIDSKELSKNPARCREMYHWLMEDVLSTQEAGGNARFVFDNNYFSKTSVGHFLMTENPAILISKVNILDKEGKPVAPFISDKWIEEKKARIGYRAFMREYMNTPIEEGSIFKADWIRWKEMKDLKKYDYLIVYCDPSFKAHTGADYKALALVGKIGREYHILKAFCRQCTVTTMVKWHYDLGLLLENKGLICYHVIEGNFNQDSLINDYNAEGETRGRYLDVLPDKHRKGDKAARIEAIAVKWERGEVFYNALEKDSSDLQAGIAQTLDFERGKRTHDDFPDACEGAISWIDRRSRPYKGVNDHDFRLGSRRDRDSLF